MVEQAPAQILNAGRLGTHDYVWYFAGLSVSVALVGMTAVILARRRSFSDRDPAKLAGVIVAAIVGALFSFMSVGRTVDGGAYLISVLTRGPSDDWLAIPMAEIVLAITGVVGMWFAFSRKKPLTYLGFALVQLPLPLFIEAMRF